MTYNKILLGMVLTALLVASCKETDIEFDQEKYDAGLKASFPVQNVDPTHTWATVGTANIAASINITSAASNEMFTYNIYGENPLTNEKVTLLASGSIRNGQTFYTSVNYEVAQPDVFIALVDQQGHMTVYPRELSAGSYETTIGGVTAAASAGSDTSEDAASAPARRVTKNGITYPDAADASNFKTVNGATVRCGEWSGGNLFYIDSNNNGQKVQPYLSGQSGPIEIYVVGEVSPSQFAIPQNTKVYILPGAKLIVPNEYEFGQYNQEVYISEGGELTANNNGNPGAISIGSNCKLYNRGTVNAGNLYIKNTGFIYNESSLTATNIDITNSGGRLVAKSPIAATSLACNGAILNESTITLTGDLSITANSSQMDNNGEFRAVNIKMAGGAKFYNNDYAEISGTVTTSSNNEVWDNQGTFICKCFRRTGGSSKYIINRCKMLVTDSMEVSGSGADAFKNEGYVQTSYLYLTTSRISLASSSIFKVTDHAYFGYNNYNRYYMAGSLGFQSIATESNKALLMMNKANRDTNSASYNISYWGPMVVACPDHFDADTGFTSHDGNPDNPQVCFKDGALFTADINHTTVVIPTSQCVEGHNGNDVPAPRQENTVPLSLRYCFEDNFPSPGDYDFNDLVLTVTPTVSGKVLTLDVSLDAVGASNCLAAAIRVVGAGAAEAAVETGFAKPRSNFGTYYNITTNEDFVTKGSDKVIVLFKDAHWAMNPTEDGLYSGSPKRIFYNTVKDRNSAKGQTIAKKTARYTLTFATEQQAIDAATQEHFDVFIVNPSRFEIHTVQNGFKLANVLVDRQNVSAYNQAYGDNMPWAIMLPSSDISPFKYPVEWTPIGGTQGYVTQEVAYEFEDASFADWATNSASANDWYKHPVVGRVYEE